MERQVKDKNLLNKFVSDFIGIVEKNGIKYIIVSGFVAIAHGRSRGTEDIDLIIERISGQQFERFHRQILGKNFECIHGTSAKNLYNDYLAENLAIRYVKKDSFVPEMELKLAKDEIDEQQLRERVKLPLTGLPFYFSTIETNIAFKEELLKSPKDIEDARHLRLIYAEKLSEEKISQIKKLIKKCRL